MVLLSLNNSSFHRFRIWSLAVCLLMFLPWQLHAWAALCLVLSLSLLHRQPCVMSFHSLPLLIRETMHFGGGILFQLTTRLTKLAVNSTLPGVLCGPTLGALALVHKAFFMCVLRIIIIITSLLSMTGAVSCLHWLAALGLSHWWVCAVVQPKRMSEWINIVALNENTRVGNFHRSKPFPLLKSSWTAIWLIALCYHKCREMEVITNRKWLDFLVALPWRKKWEDSESQGLWCWEVQGS